MEITLGNTVLLNFSSGRLVESIRVQCLVCHNMVLQESLEIFLAVFAEEEAIDPSTELLECEIGWRKDCPAKMSRCVVNCLKETSLCKTELESAELAREELDDVGRLGWGNEEAVDTMDDAVRAELITSALKSR